VLEEFGRALVPGPIVDTILSSEVVARFGTERQRASLLRSIVAGEARIAFAHAEPGAGHTARDVRTSASRQGGAWRITGRKILAPAVDTATLLLLSARTDNGDAGLFLCDARASGVAITRHHAMDPTSMLCRVEFDGAEAEPLGSAEGAALERLLETSALAAAAQMAGIAGAALDLAVAYARQRTQFDRPIGAFQAIKHRCADMLMAVETARTAAYYAAWAADEGGATLLPAVSMSKAYCGDACRTVCNGALQIHGGVGFTQEFDVHLYLKRGKLLEYAFGDAAWHRERVASLVLPAQLAS
jgi:alkylation response protein AidB-like acyl-CoA dehydrogenase